MVNGQHGHSGLVAEPLAVVVRDLVLDSATKVPVVILTVLETQPNR